MKHAEPVKIGHTRIDDRLFGGYARAVAERLLPYQWEAINDRVEGAQKSHCIENFRIAAGECQGRHQGEIFQDTDLYKWLETVAFCVECGYGLSFIPIADRAIDLIARAQQPDGYLNTYITIEAPQDRWKNLAEGHELYSGGHLIEAAVAYYNATGKDVLLGVAKRFADLVDSVFGPEEGKSRGVPGHQEIELALVKLYRVTGEERYLRLARHFIDSRGARPNYLTEEMAGRHGRNVFREFAEYDEKYAQSHLPPVEQTSAEGHAVRAVYMYSAMADLAMEYGDERLAASCERLYHSITEKRMYITGGIGSSGKLERFTTDYDLPNDRMYCESCASVGLMMFGQRMALLTGEAACYDAVERALYNTVLAGISKDADRYFYVNPLEVWPDNCLPSTSMSHVKPVRQKWFATACCPPNIARTLASLGQYIYSVSDAGLFVNLLISSRVETPVCGVPVRVKLEAGHLTGGDIRLDVGCGGETGGRIFLRLPEYIEEPRLYIDGAEAEISTEKGYISLPIRDGLTVRLTGSVPARFVAANAGVRADLGKVAVVKGPFVYCLEETDNGPNLPALSVDPTEPITECPPDPDLPGDLPILAFRGQKIEQTLKHEDLLYGSPLFRERDIPLKAVPYALWCNRTPGEMLVWIRAKI